MSVWDIGLIKLAVASGVLFIITIWSASMDTVHLVNPWWFLAAFLIFAVKPSVGFYGK